MKVCWGFRVDSGSLQREKRFLNLSTIDTLGRAVLCFEVGLERRPHRPGQSWVTGPSMFRSRGRGR